MIPERWNKTLLKKWDSIIGLLGFMLALYGLVSAILFANVTWYSYFISGNTFFLGYINLTRENRSLLEDAQKNRVILAKRYLLYLIAGILIELVARFLLHLWEFPSFKFTDEIIHVYAIGYPFTFFFIDELYNLVENRLRAIIPSVFAITLFIAFLIEIPNTYAWEWRYTIPFITMEVLNINIVAIVGWIILTVIPLFVRRILQ